LKDDALTSYHKFCDKAVDTQPPNTGWQKRENSF